MPVRIVKSMTFVIVQVKTTSIAKTVKNVCLIYT